ncbi:MAG: hypothetical protein LBM09_02430, partial [Candidatus Nomurabacteria bacterium]|nr:hypothetical protein [Candidatus Nomurabacteria bacterium]
MNNEGGNGNFWRPDNANDPFAPVQNNPAQGSKPIETAAPEVQSETQQIAELEIQPEQSQPIEQNNINDLDEESTAMSEESPAM